MDRKKLVFKDDFEPEPREWYVKLTLYEWRKVKQLLNVDLMEVLEDKHALFDKLMSDMDLCANVLYLIVEEDAKSRGVTHESFLQGLAGPSLHEAQNCLAEAIAWLFTDPAMRSRVQSVWALANQLEDATLEKVEAVQNRVFSIAKRRMQKELDKMEVSDEQIDDMLSRLSKLDGSSLPSEAI